jgi:hypothetical protein
MDSVAGSLGLESGKALTGVSRPMVSLEELEETDATVERAAP